MSTGYYVTVVSGECIRESHYPAPPTFSSIYRTSVMQIYGPYTEMGAKRVEKKAHRFLINQADNIESQETFSSSIKRTIIRCSDEENFTYWFLDTSTAYLHNPRYTVHYSPY